MSEDMSHMNYIELVGRQDCATLITKEATYKGSWKKRGGVGAFMMLARKWDRIENMAEAAKYDIIELAISDPSGADGTILAEIRDLRCYLTLVEAEFYARLNKDTETATMRSHVARTAAEN